MEINIVFVIKKQELFPNFFLRISEIGIFLFCSNKILLFTIEFRAVVFFFKIKFMVLS